MSSISPTAFTMDWPFAAELAAPLWVDHRWSERSATSREADLSRGWHLRTEALDDSLQTAWEDLRDFARAGGVPDRGEYPIIARIDSRLQPEEHRIETTRSETLILAGGPEGLRRAVFWLEDRMLTSGGPFLPIGEEQRTPVVTSRISRCFFGPINRPPANRDELTDDRDYYPPQYLNRLAHEGVNGIWLTVRLRDLYPQDWSGQPEVEPEVRLAKLRQTVAACARFGIRVYLFCIDPAAFGDGAEYLIPSSALDAHPEFAGHRDGRWTAFCTRSDKGRAYVVDALGSVFSAVPQLGGLITITVGERPTHCWSAPWSGTPVNCARCSVGDPAQAFADHLQVLRDGVSAGSPSAEVISWMYVPCIGDDPGRTIADTYDLLDAIAARTPDDVTVQVNMESTGTTEHFGRTLDVLDYSLAWVGPSQIFDRVAETVAGTGGRMGAKLQVGSSHEVATVPYVPVPGNLFRKYTELHRRGVSTVMQSWYFGNAPGPMTKAAGRLSFAPLPASEDEFLLELATPEWGADAATVVSAWQTFREAYSRFPATIAFSWFGPVHDSVVWPWHAEPVDRPIAPSWELGWQPSGDRVGEVFAPAYSFEEIIELVDGIAAQWRLGWDLMAPLRDRYVEDRPRRLDLGVAEALSLQWESTSRLLHWYQLRERVARASPQERGAMIDRMSALVNRQIPAVRRLRQLAEDDSRLGFHSEAEGHKYTPQMLADQEHHLRSTRDLILPDLHARAGDPGPLWPGWARPSEGADKVVLGRDRSTAQWNQLGEGQWRIWITKERLHLEARQPGSESDDSIAVEIEATRLWPVLPFRVHRDGWAVTERTLVPSAVQWEGRSISDVQGWTALMSWPLDLFRASDIREGFRLSVSRGTSGRDVRWPPPKSEYVRPRLCFGDRDSRSLGWAIA